MQSGSEAEGRRPFLARLTGSIAALVATAIGIPLLGYTILPALRRRAPDWADAGPIDALAPGPPRERELMLSVTDGWQKTTAKKSVWVIKDDKGTITVYAPICTHLGCGYRWEPEKEQFHCPCHHSFFSRDGSVLAGPAPRPLDVLPMKVQGGRLLVMYKEFKSGTSAKIEL